MHYSIFETFLGLLLIFNLVSAVSSRDKQFDYVTCGSVLKLMNIRSNVRLHSHDVKYGSGSGQQSVTAVEGADDHNSYWRIRSKTGTECQRGQPIECGQTIRMTHVSTNRNLHSHHFQSPLSHNLEVSAYGDNGEGDEGDHWVVICQGKRWLRDERIRLKHVATEHYLHITGDTYGRPIHGQKEVSAAASPSELSYWKALEGIYIKPSGSVATQIDHDEF